MLPPRAYVFYGLNIMRAFSIIALILVFSSSILDIVIDVKAVNKFINEKQSGNSSSHSQSMLDCDYIEGSTVPNQAAGVFWAVVSRLLIIFQVIILVLSEFGWPSKFFDRFFPVLGPSFGLGALGIFQCLIGSEILSHHVDEFSLVSAFFLFAVGCLNILLGLIFRERAKDKRSVTSWREESKGVLPKHNDHRPAFTNAGPSFVSAHFSGNPNMAADEDEKSVYSDMSKSGGSPKAGYGFGRQGEKAAGLRGFLISKPLESLPKYATRPVSSESPKAGPGVVPYFKSSNSVL